MGDLASMDLASLRAQLEAVSAAVAAKEALAGDAQKLATTIASPYSKLYNRVSVTAIHASEGKGAALIGSTVVGPGGHCFAQRRHPQTLRTLVS
jgi:asparaginyl-tRNA synthetase